MACEEAHLGLATTRQLLEELWARAGMNGCLRSSADRSIHEHVEPLLETLPEEYLEYRTVDH